MGAKTRLVIVPGGACGAPTHLNPAPGRAGSAGSAGRWGSQAEPAGEVSCRRSRTSGITLPAGSAGDGGRPAPLARIGGTMSPLCRGR